MDDILNIDECLSDSFSLSSDTDIRNIVDQWKHTDAAENPKFVDTRTFTRPKKRLFSNSDVSHAFNSTVGNSSTFLRHSNRPEMATSNGCAKETKPVIDLKIGGLVTSMQRSYLGDVSPPNTVLLESSSTMGESLITSSDFTNIDEYINCGEDSLSLTQFNNYKLSDAINDRNFLERLTNYDDSLFTKDADLENIDVNQLLNGSSGANGSGNSTLINSLNETITDQKCNGNATFDASPNDSPNDANKTFTNPLKNTTFEFGAVNNKTFSPATGKASVNEAKEDLPLNDTFNVGNVAARQPVNDRTTVNEEDNDSPKPFMGSPLQPIQTPRNTDVYQSTPSRAEGSRKNFRTQGSVNISPILSETPLPANKCQTQNVDKFIDIEIDDFQPFLRKSSKKPDSIKLRDAERQSLANFEEFENTLLLLENNKNEEEFDKILNSFTNNVRSPMNLKLRQSLDNIKKRNSLINMEKQHQDELKREKLNNSSGDTTLTSDKNRLNESFSKSPMVSSTSSSGSGERLLRRSRLFDDMLTSSGSSDKPSMGESGDTHMNRSRYNATLTLDNKEVTENNGHLAQNKQNNTYLRTEGCEKTESSLNVDNLNEAKQDSRDRFKTIRIFKKPPENAAQIPDIDNQGAEHDNKLEKTITNEHFSQINTNSPKSISAADQKAINTMTYKKSALSRPKYLSGIAKRDVYAKSNSHELLLSNDGPTETESRQRVSALKSPMGYKSKSIHNLASTNKISARSRSSDNTEKNSQQLRLLRPSEKSSSAVSVQSNANDGNLFKVPIGNPSRLTAVGTKRTGLIRPSSGYYNYNGKRFDSETDPTQFLSSNSLSSNSSKGSENRNEMETISRASFLKSANETFVAEPAKPSCGIPKASGLKQPQIRRSGLPRPMTITKR